MARRAILACGPLSHPAEATFGIRHPIDAGCLDDVSQSDPFQLREVDPSDGPGDVPERVRARVAVGIRIGKRPDTNSIEYDEEEPASGHKRCPAIAMITRSPGSAQKLLLVALADLHTLTVEPVRSVGGPDRLDIKRRDPHGPALGALRAPFLAGLLGLFCKVGLFRHVMLLRLV
jgi:hypothetical protein